MKVKSLIALRFSFSQEESGLPISIIMCNILRTQNLHDLTAES